MRHPYDIEFLNNMLAYFNGTPPPFNALYDINSDGYINIQDILICLTYL